MVVEYQKGFKSGISETIPFPRIEPLIKPWSTVHTLGDDDDDDGDNDDDDDLWSAVHIEYAILFYSLHNHVMLECNAGSDAIYDIQEEQPSNHISIAAKIAEEKMKRSIFHVQRENMWKLFVEVKKKTLFKAVIDCQMYWTARQGWHCRVFSQKFLPLAWYFKKKRLVLVGGISINFCFEFIFWTAWNNFGHKGDNSSWCWFSKLFPPRVWTFFDLYLNIFVEVCFVFLTSKCEMRKALFLKNKKNLLKNNIGLRAKVFLCEG